MRHKGSIKGMWLINLVENLLAVTKIEEGKVNLNSSVEVMDEVVTEALRHVNRRSREHTIRVTSAQELILAKIDARLIVQVIVNLVDNAIKYTPADSVIEIHTELRNKWVAVSVSDNGPGIPDDQKPKVFDMFYCGANKVIDSRRSMGLGLPDMDGVEVICTIRSWSNFPIIVISARSEERDKIEALDAGADDYLTKPFSVEELLARIRTTQRRLSFMSSEMLTAGSVFENGKLRVDYASGCAYLDGQELHLTPIEFKLLCLLSKNAGKVLTHTFITQNIWMQSWDSNMASLRVFMATLRKKLEPTPDSPQYIQTHIGVGYRMVRVE